MALADNQEIIFINRLWELGISSIKHLDDKSCKLGIRFDTTNTNTFLLAICLCKITQSYSFKNKKHITNIVWLHLVNYKYIHLYTLLVFKEQKHARIVTNC